MRNLILSFFVILTLVFSCRAESDDVLEQKNTSYDVYVSGRENSKACYWKNTIKTDLINGDNINTIDIKVENNDVYVTGSLMATTTLNKEIHYFWKNNIRTDVKQYLNIPNNVQNNITCFSVINGDIYFAGYVENPNATSGVDKYELCYWKNGSKTIIYKSNYSPFAESILVDGSDVYVSAVRRDNNQNTEYGYFKNTAFYSLNVGYIYNLVKNSNGIHLLYQIGLKYYSKNLNTNAETLIGDYTHPASTLGKIISHNANNDLYTIQSFLGTAYFKNNLQIIPNFSTLPFIQDMFILDNNMYMIKYENENNAYNGKVFINSIESQSLNSTPNGTPYYSGTLNSIYVLEN